MAKMKCCGSLKRIQFFKCLLISILLIAIIVLTICYALKVLNLLIILLGVLIGVFVIYLLIIRNNNQNSKNEFVYPQENCRQPARDRKIKKRKARWSESYIWECGCCIINILNCPYRVLIHIFDGNPFLFGLKDDCGNIEDELKQLSKSDSSVSISKNFRREFQCRGLKIRKNAKVWAIEPGKKWMIEDIPNSPYIIEKIIEENNKKLKVCKENDFFADIWVLSHLVLAIVIFALWEPSTQNGYWGVFFIFLGIFRVYDYFVYQTNAVFFELEKTKREAKVMDRDKTPPIILNPYRILILSILSFVNVIIWFAVFYRYISQQFDRLSSLKFSFCTMTGFGNTNIFLADHIGIISLIQSAIGLYFIILILAQLVSSLPKPRYYG